MRSQRDERVNSEEEEEDDDKKDDKEEFIVFSVSLSLLLLYVLFCLVDFAMCCESGGG